MIEANKSLKNSGWFIFMGTHLISRGCYFRFGNMDFLGVKVCERLDFGIVLNFFKEVGNDEGIKF